MRPHICSFVSLFAERFPILGPVVELGAKRYAAQEKLANLRPFFPGETFIGCDMEAGVGVDRLENLKKLTFADGEAGTIILCDTIEHVQDVEIAMEEIDRCLDPVAGLLLMSSVMLFPIHGFPNDYWRFTPEGFRFLGQRFPWTAVFYAGDPSFPHTVILLAGRKPPEKSLWTLFLDDVKALTLVPHYTDSKSERMFSGLATLVESHAAENSKRVDPILGNMGRLSQSGWVLTPGTWVKVVVENGEAKERSLVFRAGGKLIQTIPFSRWNALVELSSHGPVETAFQFDPVPGTMNQYNQVEVYFMSSTGEDTLVARSAAGVLLPEVEQSSGFHLHSMDNKEIAARENAKRLVQNLRDRGEAVVLDLGCGFRKAGSIGVDARAENTTADVICLLGFESLPFEEGTVDEVVCRDFLEHLPKSTYLESRKSLHFPVIHLMDDVWRVLKPGGLFRSWTPVYPHPEVFQDPTHLSAWTMKSMDYFCGLYEGARRIYGIKACFEKIIVREEGFYLYAELRKPMV